MKNLFKVFSIIALVAVIGFSFAACGGGDDGGGESGSALNGTWSGSGEEWKFNNGSFEISSQGSALVKGTYTTSGSNITITITHAWGAHPDMGLEAKWYSRADLAALGVPAADLNALFTTYTETYSINGSQLTLGSDTYTKQGGSNPGTNPGTGALKDEVAITVSDSRLIGTWKGGVGDDGIENGTLVITASKFGTPDTYNPTGVSTYASIAVVSLKAAFSSTVNTSLKAEGGKVSAVYSTGGNNAQPVELLTYSISGNTLSFTSIPFTGTKQ